MPILRLPVFDTTPPGVGGLTETASVRVTGISPLRGSLRAAPMRTHGWTGVSLLPDGVIAKQLVPLFCGRMGTARHLVWPSLMQETCTGGSWRILQCRSALVKHSVRERISVPDVTRAGPVFFKVQREANCVAPLICHWGLFSDLTTKNLSFLKIFSLRLWIACCEIPTSSANSHSVFL